MAALSFIVAYLAAAGAFVSWLVGLFYYFKTQMQIAPAQTQERWLAVAAWPFAVVRLSGPARASAAIVNKALVAFFLFLFVAAGAFGAAFFFAASGIQVR